MADAARPARLPVLRTVRDAYVETFRNLSAFIRIAWAWLLIMTALVAFASWFLWPLQELALAAGTSSSVTYVAPVISLVAGTSVAVAWHRLLLARDMPPSIAYVRLDGVVLRYVMVALAMALPFYLILDVLAALFIQPSEQTTVREIIRLGVAIAAWLVPVAATYLGTRLSPILPAIALGRADVTLAAVWRATAWNWWRLFLGLILSGLLPMILVYAPFLVRDWNKDTTQAETQLGFIQTNLETELAGFVGGIFAVSFISFAFRHFFGATARTEEK